jgi:lysyl-tRNA synthetase class 1
VIAYDWAWRTAEIVLPTTPRPLPYRMLASVADITTGEPVQILRILHEIDPERSIDSLGEVHPRLDKATAWATEQLPVEQRTRVLDKPDLELLDSLDEVQRRSVDLLLAGLDEHWSLEGLTTLVYGVPKQMLGLPPDVKPTPELKMVQRTFFVLLYRLLVGRDTGSRLPTLLLATGADRVGSLLLG